MSDVLRLACIDSHAPPLFGLAGADGTRQGYEPEAAAVVANELGLRLQWVVVPWAEMIPAVQQDRADAVWCGQAITPERRALVDFTRPYAIFDESVLVPRGRGWSGPEDLRRRRVAAIAGSANMALAESFDGAEPVGFDASNADVFAAMLTALRRGGVDAVVDDDIALAPLAEDPEVEIAFTVPTRNQWGIGVGKHRPELHARLDDALAQVIADGRLARAWDRWIPDLAFPVAT